MNISQLSIVNMKNTLSFSHDEQLERLAQYKAAIQKNPSDFTSKFKYGVLLYELAYYKEAADILCSIVKLGPNEFEAYHMACKALNHMGNYKDALTVAKLGLDKFPLKIELLQEFAHALYLQGNMDQAVETLQLAVDKSPENMSSHIALASLYIWEMNYEQALDILHNALTINENSYAVHNTIGAIYVRMGDSITASEYFLKSARIKPNFPEPLLNLAGCFEEMDKANLALQFYDEVIKFDPTNVMALCAKASLMCIMGMAQEALPDYEKAIDILSRKTTKTNYEYITHHSNYIFFMHYAPDTTRKDIFKELVEWQNNLCHNITEKPRTSFSNPADPDKKLRIGFISSGFTVHPVGQMIFQALQHINKDEFEIYLYSDLGKNKHTYLTNELEELADKYVTVTSINNDEILNMMREDQLDIMVEMTGYSDGGKRLSIAAARAAPVQVKWVGGLFNTTGLSQMDWILADKIEIPEGDEKWYTESIYRMPDDYIVYNPPFYAPEISELPATKNGYITFGNLNNLAKTNSFSIKLWADILHAVPKSKLLLKTRKMDSVSAQDHIRQAFASHGISDRRLIFEGGEQHRSFMNVYNRIDIALDPHPYTGGLTTCEALWMGVPVITLPGKTFAGRHAETHLTTAGLEQFIASSEEDYLNIAVDLATNIDKLSTLRNKLREQVKNSPLVDGPRFARNYEKAMRHMWTEWCKLKETSK